MDKVGEPKGVRFMAIAFCTTGCSGATCEELSRKERALASHVMCFCISSNTLLIATITLVAANVYDKSTTVGNDVMLCTGVYHGYAHLHGTQQGRFLLGKR